MNPMSTDVKDLLAAAAIGTFAATSGWAIYIGQGAETPDTLIALFDLPAGAPLQPITKTCGPLSIGTERVRIKVRSNSYTEAWDKAREIEAELDRETDVEVGSVFYSVIYRITPITFDAYDEQNRAVWYQDFAALRQIESSSSSSSESTSLSSSSSSSSGA